MSFTWMMRSGDGNDGTFADREVIGENIFDALREYAASAIVRVRFQGTAAPARLDWRGGEPGEEWTAIGVIMPMFVTWTS